MLLRKWKKSTSKATSPLMQKEGGGGGGGGGERGSYYYSYGEDEKAAATAASPFFPVFTPRGVKTPNAVPASPVPRALEALKRRDGSSNASPPPLAQDVELLLKANAFDCQQHALAALERMHSAETLHCLLAVFEVERAPSAEAKLVRQHAMLARFVLRGCKQEVCVPGDLRTALLAGMDDARVSAAFIELKACLLHDLRGNSTFMGALAQCLA